MVEVKLDKIMKKGKALFLACDQGMEHGPADFNEVNIDPNYIIDIAKKGKYSALIFQKGICEKYNKEIKASKIPLIIKLNGKTSLVSGEPVSQQICTVEEAIKLGASAVGYTIYVGSEHEHIMFQEFEKIQREAHAKGLPVIVWAYPRGKGTEGKSKNDLMAYACRVALEIGADIVKVSYDGDPQALRWAVKCAGRTKVIIAGGAKEDENGLYSQTREIMESGAIGLAIGRNIWQAQRPELITENLKKIIFG